MPTTNHTTYKKTNLPPRQIIKTIKYLTALMDTLAKSALGKSLGRGTVTPLTKRSYTSKIFRIPAKPPTISTFRIISQLIATEL
jgi:hypothetical protein